MLYKENYEERVRAATKLKDGKAAGKTLKDLRKELKKAEDTKKVIRHQANILYLDQQKDNAILGLESILSFREKENRLLQEKVELLEERDENGSRNRQWCDDASNYLGPMAQKALETMEPLLVDLARISAAYHEVGQDYPWER